MAVVLRRRYQPIKAAVQSSVSASRGWIAAMLSRKMSSGDTAFQSESREGLLVATEGLLQECISPFFDLPRELRDMIYEYLLELSRPVVLMTGLRTTVHDYQLTSPRLISRQFKDEFDERQRGFTKLSIEDSDDFCFTPLRIPASLRSITRLDLRLMLFCYHYRHHNPLFPFLCEARRELVVGHRNWIAPLLVQFNNLLHLHVDLYLEPLAHCCVCNIPVTTAIEDWLQQFDKVTKLSLWRCDYNTVTREIDGPPRMLASWSRGEPTDKIYKTVIPSRIRRQIQLVEPKQEE